MTGLYFLTVLGLEVQEQDAGRFGFSGDLSPWLQMMSSYGFSSMQAHPRCFFLIRTLVLSHQGRSSMTLFSYPLVGPISKYTHVVGYDFSIRILWGQKHSYHSGTGRHCYSIFSNLMLKVIIIFLGKKNHR